MGLRRNLWNSVDVGTSTIQCKSCGLAKVLWIQPHGSAVEPPWDLWGRIVQWFGVSEQGLPWRIFWFPATIPRMLPLRGNPVGPEHINGGYCYPCNPNVIVVYRLEEATRVLIHELLHAACTDPNASLQMKEATTETWAELFLVAVCSKGEEQAAKHLWELQGSWIANQNALLRKHYHVQTPNDYAWRYTVGKEQVFKNLHIPLPLGKPSSNRSSRLTHPSICSQN